MPNQHIRLRENKSDQVSVHTMKVWARSRIVHQVSAKVQPVRNLPCHQNDAVLGAIYPSRFLHGFSDSTGGKRLYSSVHNPDV